jgi:hypothetical protein
MAVASIMPCGLSSRRRAVPLCSGGHGHRWAGESGSSKGLWKVMQKHNKKRPRLAPRVEALEGKTLLSTSTGLMGQHWAHHVMNASAIAQVAAPLSGTLSGIYSNVHIPLAGYLLNYSTSGSLTPVGSAHLHGSIFARPGHRAGRGSGQFSVRNNGGSMAINVFASATAGAYTYRVIRAFGTDASYRGGTGAVTIAQNPTHSDPFYVSGQATMTFNPG